MTLTASRPGSDPGTTAVHADARQLWRSWRRPAAVVALVLATAIALGLMASGQRRGYLDPEGVDAGGARALVRLLAGQGVVITPARTAAQARAAAGPGTTVLVTVPALVGRDHAAALLATGADLVLVAPGEEVAAFVDGASVEAAEEPARAEPACSLPVARRAGEARVGGLTYDLPESAIGCYPVAGVPSLGVADVDGRSITVLGAPDPLTNRYLGEDGNAALALGLLGARPRLVWYRPTLEAGPGQGAALTDVLPGWVGPTAAMLLLAGAAAALWRGRRLGPVVVEPLPVVVRSVESVEGLARLYRRGRVAGHAAAALREGCTQRLRTRLGLPAAASTGVLVAAVAERTGRPPGAVAAVLAGPDPPDGAALVRLADDLDALEQEVSRS